jgi:hypothetical protein
MENAELLAGSRVRAGEKERREDQRADHEVIVPPRPADVNAPLYLSIARHVHYDSALHCHAGTNAPVATRSP